METKKLLQAKSIVAVLLSIFYGWLFFCGFSNFKFYHLRIRLLVRTVILARPCVEACPICQLLPTLTLLLGGAVRILRNRRNKQRFEPRLRECIMAFGLFWFRIGGTKWWEMRRAPGLPESYGVPSRFVRTLGYFLLWASAPHVSLWVCLQRDCRKQDLNYSHPMTERRPTLGCRILVLGISSRRTQ